MSRRTDQAQEELKQLAGTFFAQESNRSPMITVTNALLSSDFKRATIFFTVLPENMEEPALAFAKRKRSDFRNFAKKNFALRRIPFFEFEIDKGEKNRQRIDALSKS